MSSRRPTVWPGHVMVGEITAPHGIDGSVRVYPTTDFPERFLSLTSVIVDKLGGETRIQDVRRRAQMMVVRFDGVSSRESAERLRGALLMVPESSLPALDKDEFYWHELVGLTVEEAGTGRILGTIGKVMRTGAAHDVFEVERANQKPILIPALKSIVKNVDLSQKRMQVDLLPGLEE